MKSDREQFEFASKAVRLSIDHLIEHGFDDIFKKPMFSDSYELGIIRRKHEDFRQQATKSALSFLKIADLNVKKIGPTFKCMIPKDLYSYRNVHWIDPFDLVNYLSLAVVLFDSIEAARRSKDENCIHSHRRSIEDGQLFDRTFGYKSFRERSGELSRQNVGKWKIVTDISVFFDRISNHQLENHLREVGCSDKHVTLLRDVLLQWAGDRRSHGVPVGCDASRIISEAALISVDRKLSERGISYVRYVDDFRIFAETRADAYEHLRTLSELLLDEGLHLNYKKTFVTKIVSEEEYIEQADLAFLDFHEIINENERVLKPVRTLVSGKTSISRRYVEPGKDALVHLRKIEKSDIERRYRDAPSAEKSELLKLVVKYFIYADQDIKLIDMVLDQQITSIIYVVDALIKEAGRLPQSLRSDLKERIFVGMGGLSCGYPFHVSLLNLFASAEYEDSRSISHVVDNAKISDCQVFLREAIFIGCHQLDRDRIRRLAIDVFPVVPAPTKRAIFFAITRSKKMSNDEKRPIIRNMKQTCDDWFIVNDEYQL